MPLVSVVLPVFNSSARVKRAIESVFAQRFDNLELIVVDDGSTDSTPQVLRIYDDRARIIRFERNRGAATARNAGTRVAQGSYVAFIDADDMWTPDHIGRMLAPLEGSPNAVLAFCNAVPVDASGKPCGRTYIPPDRAYAPTMEDLLEQGWWPIIPTTLMLRREVFERCGGFPEEFKGSRGWEDTYLVLLMREQGPFIYVNEQLSYYRRLPFVPRMEKYAPNFKLYSRYARLHWGEAGDRMVRKSSEFYSLLLVLRGMHALANGDRILARRAFLCTRHYRPLEMRNIMRIARTFLPARLAMHMTAEKWRALPSLLAVDPDNFA